MSEWVSGWFSDWVDGCPRTSADSSLVVAELRSSPCTFLLVLGQVLTLLWWWQSSELVLYLHTCAGTSADSTLVVAELRSGPVPPYLRLDKCWLYPGGGRAQKWSLYLPTCARTSVYSTLVVAELISGPCTFLLALGQVLTLPWWWQSSEVVPVPFYFRWDKCWLYSCGGRAHNWSLYLPTCAGTSADFTLVVAKLRSGPSTLQLFRVCSCHFEVHLSGGGWGR